MPMNNDGQYGYLFMQELKLPSTHEKLLSHYRNFGERVHWIDSNNIPGAFQMNTSWWYKPNREQVLSNPESQVAKPHFHNYPEILGFYGSDPYHPYELNGEIEFYINGEQHILTKSTMVFIPPNLPHCPLLINRADMPMFHFSVVMNEIYGFEGNGSFRAE